MTDQELIKCLRDYVQNYIELGEYNLNPGIAVMIANRMEQLVALAENGQSAMDTNQKLTVKVQKLIKDLRNAYDNGVMPCDVCKHNVKCGKSCEFYEEGNGVIDTNNVEHDLPWSCMDFDFGTCRKLENTPCYGCNFRNNWEYKGE